MPETRDLNGRGARPANTDRLKSVMILAATAAGAALMFFVDPTKAAYFPKCFSYLITGRYCPGCGAARSAHALLHGHILRAMDFNVMFVMMVPLFGYIAANSASILLRGKPLPEPPFTPAVAWTIVGLAAAFTLLRNIPASPFSWLAP